MSCVRRAGLIAAAKVFGDFNDPAQRTIDRSIVRERLANVRVQLNESACLDESCVVFAAHGPRPRKIGLRDVTRVDFVPVLDRWRFAGKFSGMLSVNNGDPGLHAWSHGAPR